MTQKYFKLRHAAVLTLAALAGCQSFSSTVVTRYPNPAGSVTSKAVEIAGAPSLIFVSGNTPAPADGAAAEFSAAYWGDTEAQTASTLKKINAALAEARLSMADVVKLQVFLVAPAQGQLADLAGFGRGYNRYFGAATGGKLPSRTVVTVASLGRPGMLVEIEVTAVRSPAARTPSHCTVGRNSVCWSPAAK
jgi:enamine deaminase RidA (YjgF/YER057c/UK114 family)